MTKTALVSLAVLTLSASVAMAAQHKTHRHAVKPSAAAAAAAPASPAVGASPGFWTGGVSSADREMYIRNERDSGLAGKR
jgi:hypothetical protein